MRVFSSASVATHSPEVLHTILELETAQRARLFFRQAVHHTAEYARFDVQDLARLREGGLIGTEHPLVSRVSDLGELLQHVPAVEGAVYCRAPNDLRVETFVPRDVTRRHPLREQRKDLLT